jgi:hypothetical protein
MPQVTQYNIQAHYIFGSLNLANLMHGTVRTRFVLTS